MWAQCGRDEVTDEKGEEGAVCKSTEMHKSFQEIARKDGKAKGKVHSLGL